MDHERRHPCDERRYGRPAFPHPLRRRGPRRPSTADWSVASMTCPPRSFTPTAPTTAAAAGGSNQGRSLVATRIRFLVDDTARTSSAIPSAIVSTSLRLPSLACWRAWSGARTKPTVLPGDPARICRWTVRLPVVVLVAPTRAAPAEPRFPARAGSAVRRDAQTVARRGHSPSTGLRAARGQGRGRCHGRRTMVARV
jgi:hypothetical protein